MVLSEEVLQNFFPCGCENTALLPNVQEGYRFQSGPLQRETQTAEGWGRTCSTSELLSHLNFITLPMYFSDVLEIALSVTRKTRLKHNDLISNTRWK